LLYDSPISNNIGIMPISVRGLYTQICDCLLEPIQLSGDTLTDDQFIAAVNEVLSEFLSLGTYVKPMISQTLTGVRVYPSPGPSSVIKNLAVDEAGIPMNSGFYWDQSDAYWQNKPTGNPNEWRQDQLEEQGFEIRPAPGWEGYEIEIDGIGMYGVISNTSFEINGESLECDPLAIGGLLGTISSDDYGSIYADVAGPMLGTISEIMPSNGNITQFSVTAPEYVVTSLDDYIADVSDLLEPYLRLNLMRMYTPRRLAGSSIGQLQP